MSTIKELCDAIIITENSTAIKQIGYATATSMLYVEFTNGGLYSYKNVTAEMYSELLDSPSRGAWVNANLSSFGPERLEAI